MELSEYKVNMHVITADRLPGAVEKVGRVWVHVKMTGSGRVRKFKPADITPVTPVMMPANRVTHPVRMPRIRSVRHAIPAPKPPAQDHLNSRQRRIQRRTSGVQDWSRFSAVTR